MPINILMPALSPTMEKGNLAKWLKKEGDKVKSGDIIAEIETDKATMEVEAVDEGTIAKIVVPEGTADVPVNQVIAVLAGEGEDVKAAAAGAGKARRPRRSRKRPRQRRSASAARQAGGAEAAQLPAQPPRPQPRRSLKPRRSRRRRATASSPRRWPGGSRRKPASICRASRAPARTAASSRATSKARNPARAEAGRRAGRRASAPAIAPSMSDQQIRALFEEGSYEVVPHDGMRRTIAQRLTAVDADHPAFLSDDGLQHRQAPGRARGDQRRRAQGQGRQAGLQAFGQRLRHQGAGARAAAHPRRQCELDRRRHAQAQAFRRRRRGGDAGRPDHADRPPRRKRSRSPPSPTR